jgi:hypothetical protein
LGFVASRADTSPFIYKTKNAIVYMLVYVDDIIIASSCDQATSILIDQLREEFAVKDLRDLHYFLGIEVVRKCDELVLTQKKYVADLLRKTNMLNCKGVSTPMGASEKLSKADGTLLSAEEATKYRSIVGGL